MITPPANMNTSNGADIFAKIVIIGLIISAVILVIVVIVSLAGKKKHPALIAIFSVLVAIGVLILVVQCAVRNNSGDGNNGGSNSSPSLFHRSATNSDIHVEMSDEVFSTSYKITPYCDIEDLEITVIFADSNRNTVAEKVKYVGDVKKGREYEVSVSITELGFLDIFKISQTTCRVTGGTVSYLRS